VQVVPVLVHLILASPAVTVGVSTIVKLAPAAVVAPVVTVIAPVAAILAADPSVTFLVVVRCGTPLVSEPQATSAPVS
jgi:hypothetical protein